MIFQDVIMNDKKEHITDSCHDAEEKYMAYTYMVRCRDGSLYTGWTNNLEKRVKAHNEGKGAKYTRNRRPVELVYAELHKTKQEAMSREAKIKRFTKKEKEELAANYQEKQQYAQKAEAEEQKNGI